MKARMRLVAVLGAVLALVGLSPGAAAQSTYTLPLVLAADTAGLTSFMRIINRASQAGTVQIHAIDDTGRRFGPVSLAVGAGAVVHFTSRELEQGNPEKGLATGVGDGSGNWRLEFTTTLDIRPLAYIRTSDGFVTPMHDVAPVSGRSHSIDFFNPGSNDRQVSRLRILNPGTITAEVTISGRDDTGASAPGGMVRMTLPGGDSRMLTAQELEAGGKGFEGRLGDGAGKWRLDVSATAEIQVMSLLRSPTGHLANLSTAPSSQREDPQRPPGETFRDCPGCPEMVVVPAGSFQMGSPESEAGRYDDEGPVHRVEIARPFAVGVHEVTRGEYTRFVSATGRSMGDSCRTYVAGKWVERSGRHWLNPGFGQTDAHPVVCVNWYDAKAYVGWLSGETGQEYRLLSGSEREYVARAGTAGPYHFGSSLSSSQANYGRNRGGTAPVGSYSANGFGLHDVHGNVWEWVEDCWNVSYAGAPADGSAWTSGDCTQRVVRSGSWISPPRNVRSAIRDGRAAGNRSVNSGFRVARTLTP